MKRNLVIVLLILLAISVSAQEKQKNRIGVRYAIDWVLDDGGGEKGTYRVDKIENKNLELFYKWYLKKNWFIEPSLSMYWFEYDSGSYISAGSVTNWSRVHCHNLNLKEKGMGASLVGGYSFPIIKRLSLDVFAGVNVKYAFTCRHLGEKMGLLRDVYYPAYPSWQAGLNLNYWFASLSFKVGSYLTQRYKLLENENRPTFYSLGLGISF
ncbi:MAG: hypothetical protein J6C87_10510 [Bacteroides sp.]|nr:hypothetical protein [Bacteroides sp.]